MPSQRLVKVFRNRFGHFRAGWRILFYLAITIGLHASLDSFVDSFLLIQGEDLSDYSLLQNRLVSKSMKLLFVLVPGLVLLKWVDRRPVSLLGLGFYGRASRELFTGMLMGLVLVVGSVVILRMTGLASFSFNGFSVDLLIYLLGTLGVLAVSACYEETLFRGYVFQSLIEGSNFWIAVGVYSLLFGLSHIDNPEATVYMVAFAVVAGVFLGTMYYRTRALWMCIGVHFVWNWTMGPIFGMGVSGSRFLRRTLFTYKPSESGFIIGAEPMSEIIFGLIMIVITTYVWKARWMKPAEYNRRLWEPYISDGVKSTFDAMPLQKP
jgi:membrane protease YdiL (CAAX protease family)